MVRVLEREHVLAQSNVWERRSEKQMAALRMEGGRKGGGRVMMNQPTTIICAARVFILSTSLFHPPSREEMEWGGVRGTES